MKEIICWIKGHIWEIENAVVLGRVYGRCYRCQKWIDADLIDTTPLSSSESDLEKGLGGKK